MTLIPYFGLQKNYIVDGFAIKFFIHSFTEFIPNIIIFFQQVIIFNPIQDGGQKGPYYMKIMGSN